MKSLQLRAHSSSSVLTSTLKLHRTKDMDIYLLTHSEYWALRMVAVYTQHLVMFHVHLTGSGVDPLIL